MSGTNEPVFPTGSIEKSGDSAGATLSSRDAHSPNSAHDVPGESINSEKLLATDVLVVDWDGSDDPQNPKKYVA